VREKQTCFNAVTRTAGALYELAMLAELSFSWFSSDVPVQHRNTELGKV